MTAPPIRIIIVSVLALSVSTSPGAIVRVSPGGDNSNGETWQTAYTTVGTAVTNASNGDDIWIREGTYFESIDITKPLSLFGGFAGTEENGEFDLRDWKARLSVLDASGTTESVIDIVGVEGVILDGLHIQNAETRLGGGVEINPGSAEIRHCRIENNFGTFGGGVFCIDGTVSIKEVEIHRNRSANGGGILIFTKASASISDSTISHNISGSDGGGIDCISGTSGSMMVEGCLIESNTSEDNNLGGGIHSDDRRSSATARSEGILLIKVAAWLLRTQLLRIVSLKRIRRAIRLGAWDVEGGLVRV